MDKNLYSIQIEESVLSALMHTNGGEDDVVSKLSCDSFYAPQHKVIFKHYKALYESGSGHDMIMVYDSIKLDANDSRLVTEEFMIKLNQTMGLSHFLDKHVDQLNEYASRRALFNAAERIKTISIDTTQYNLEDALAQSESILEQASLGSDEESSKDVYSLALELFGDINQRMEDRAAGKEKIEGVRTGFKHLDAKIGAIGRGELVIIAARPSMGKELHNDSKVYMMDGSYKRIGDMIVGDSVASVDGGESTVLGVFPQGLKDVYNVSFSDGRSVLAGIDHQWEVDYKGWSCKKVLNTSEVIDLLKKPHLKNRLTIDLCSGDFGSKCDFAIDPYLLGVLLGDGGLSSGGVRLSNSDSQIIDKCKILVGDLKLKTKNNVDYDIVCEKGGKNWLKTELNNLGLLGLRSHEKFIPCVYFEGTKDVRLNLIRGMIDTDGTVEKNGSVRYTTTSKQMSDDFVLLARSLGCWAKTSSRVTNFTYNGEIKSGKRSYTTTLSHSNLGDFVSLDRKSERLKARLSDRTMNLTFSSIKKVGSSECTCITVSHERELFLTDDYIVTHNTALAQDMMLDMSFVQQKPVLFQSAEMPKEAIMRRIMSSMAEIKTTDIRNATIPDNKWFDYQEAVKKLQASKLEIDDQSAPTIAHIRKNCRRMRAKYGYVGAVFIDYLTLLTPPLKTDQNYLAVGSISKALSALAKEFNCPVFALSQLSRKVEDRADKRPMMSDLRESGQIEQDANTILFIYRDEVYNKQSKEAGITEIIAAKVRDGEVGTVKIWSELQYSRFVDADVNYLNELNSKGDF